MTCSRRSSAVALCVLAVLALTPHATGAGHIDPCYSTAASAGGSLLMCPSGDGWTLASIGATVDVVVLDSAEHPVPGIPAADFWIVGPDEDDVLCNGIYSVNADGVTDLGGYTSISGAIAAGGYHPDSYVVAGGFIIGYWGACDAPLGLALVSPDINADLAVDLLDLALLGQVLGFGYDPAMDFNADSDLNMLDFSLFAQHFGHACDPN